MGFGLVLYANAALQAALKASTDVLGALKRDGSLPPSPTGWHASGSASAPWQRTTMMRSRNATGGQRDCQTAQGPPDAKPWDGIISQEEQRAYRPPASAGAPVSASGPALLIIDVQYRTVGSTPKPFWQAIEEFPTACGEVGWGAVAPDRAFARRSSANAIGRCLSLRLAQGDLRQGPARRQGARDHGHCREWL